MLGAGVGGCRMFRFTTTLAGSSVSARGASIYSTGFEAPTYHTGQPGAVNGGNSDAVVVANPGEVKSGIQAAELAPTAGAHLLRRARKP